MYVCYMSIYVSVICPKEKTLGRVCLPMRMLFMNEVETCQ